MKVPRAALLIALGTAAPACLVGDPAPPTVIEDAGTDTTTDADAADADADTASDVESDGGPEADTAPGEDASSKLNVAEDASRLAAIRPPSGPLKA